MQFRYFSSLRCRLVYPVMTAWRWSVGMANDTPRLTGGKVPVEPSVAVQVTVQSISTAMTWAPLRWYTCEQSVCCAASGRLGSYAVPGPWQLNVVVSSPAVHRTSLGVAVAVT